MNNAYLASAVPGRNHPLAFLPHPNNTNSSVRLLSSAAESSFPNVLTSVTANMTNSSHASQMLPISYSQRDLFPFPPGLQYFNGFNGLQAFPMNLRFNIPPAYADFYSKSPGMMSPAVSFFNNFGVTKDDDMAWQKQSPNNFPDSPRSGSRSSPVENSRKKPPKARSFAEQNLCPVCGQTIAGKNLREHFLEELKSYHNQDAAAVQPARADESPAESSTSHHGRSCSATPSEVDSRLEIYQRVRNNRKARLSSPGDIFKSRPSAFVDHQHQSQHSRKKTSAAKQNHDESQPDDTEIVVDVESDDTGAESDNITPSMLNFERSTSSPSSILLPRHKRKFSESEEVTANDMRKSPRQDKKTTDNSHCIVCEKVLQHKSTSLLTTPYGCHHQWCDDCRPTEPNETRNIDFPRCRSPGR